MTKSIPLIFNGKTLMDAHGHVHDVDKVLQGSLGKVEAIQMTVMVAAPATKEAPAQAFRKAPTTDAEKKAGDAAQAALAKAQVKAIAKGSKVDRMFQMMLRKNGATFKEIQKEFGWSEGGTGSYVHFYPKDCGYKVVREPRKGTSEQQYRLVLPEGQKGLLYR